MHVHLPGEVRMKEDGAAGLLETSVQDLRYGWRMLRKNPGFSLIAVLTLALGIGASTAVFSVVNGVLLKPLPYPRAERIVVPMRRPPDGVNLGFSEIPWGLREARLLQQESKTFESLGTFKSDTFNLTGVGDPVLLEGLRASAGFFPALGIAPALGRAYSTDEDQPGHEHEVVLSHQLWRDRFGFDPGILGRSIALNGAAYTVVGVMPPGFTFPRGEEMPASFSFPREAQLWVPLALPPQKVHPYDPDELAAVARIRPGISISQAQAEMDLLARRLEEMNPPAKGWYNSRVIPLAQQVAGDTRRPLLLMLGAVGVVLLIASSNVASLLLARSLARTNELALRSALGAGRPRLIRLLLTESLLLSFAGGAAGLLLALAGIRFVKAFGPLNLPRLGSVNLDPSVAAFALGLTFLTGILFGLAPAIGATRGALVESLKKGGQRVGGAASTPALRNALLVGEVALALVLVIAAGLLIRTFNRLLRVDPGFNAEHALTFELSLPSVKYPDYDHIVQLYGRALEKLKAVPGVEAAGIGETVPLGGNGEGSGLRIPDRPVTNINGAPFAAYTIASPGYFAAVGTPLLRGRVFVETDTATSTPVTVISRAMAEKYWSGQDAIGKQVGLGSTRFPLMTIVGIVADVKHVSLREESGPELYVPYTQKVYPSMLMMQVALRTKGDPTSVLNGVREAIRAVDPDLPVAKVTTLRAITSNSLAQPRFTMLLLGLFGALALALAAVGMYGVISYSVTQRTQEIGIRMALGARRGSVFGMVLGQGARLAAIGIAIGVAAALGVTRLMSRFLFGVQATDPLTFAGVALLLIVVALLACYVPAHRATRVDPMIALRYE